jgi:hypothetical protein
MEETHARSGGWAHRSDVVGPKAAPDCPDHQHVIGPPPFSRFSKNSMLIYLKIAVEVYVTTVGSGGSTTYRRGAETVRENDPLLLSGNLKMPHLNQE